MFVSERYLYTAVTWCSTAILFFISWLYAYLLRFLGQNLFTHVEDFHFLLCALWTVDRNPMKHIIADRANSTVLRFDGALTVPICAKQRVFVHQSQIFPGNKPEVKTSVCLVQ